MRLLLTLSVFCTRHRHSIEKVNLNYNHTFLLLSDRSGRRQCTDRADSERVAMVQQQNLKE